MSPEPKQLAFVTKGAIHRPIDFQIDGKTYQVARLNRARFEDAQKLEAQAAKGKVAALYAQLSLISNVPQAVADELDVQDLRDLLAGIRKRIATGEKGEEKNVSKPGGTPAV